MPLHYNEFEGLLAQDEVRTVIFGTEPLVAYLADEPGSDVVEELITLIEQKQLKSYINPVQITEIIYVSEQIETNQGETARLFIESLCEIGLEILDISVDIADIAAGYRLTGYTLGDAFAVATAAATHGWLVVGADTDYENIEQAVCYRNTHP